MIEYKDPSDNWYKYKGVKPPERQSHGLTEDNVEEHIKKNSQHECVWKQKGPYIFCTAGPFEHGKNVGVNRRLLKSVKGKPILSKI